MNVPRSSIRGLDRVVLEDGAKKGLFFAYEGSRRWSQLTPQRRCWQNVNKRKAKSKLNFRISNIFLAVYLYFWWLLSHESPCIGSLLVVVNVICIKFIRLLLLRGGIEPNPGPENDKNSNGFSLLSQNCRGLTDKKKLAKLLKSIYPLSRRLLNKFTIACLQETHLMDRFTTSIWHRGEIVVDNGERNQKGVCILLPDSYQLCYSKISGLGRWAIAAFQDFQNQ